MNNIAMIPYPYLWQNNPIKHDSFEEWIGRKHTIMCDPDKTHTVIEKTHRIFKKIVALYEALEAMEKKWAIWTKPIRYLLQLFSSVQTLKAAKCWAKVTEAFEKSDWETALEQLHRLNHRKEKETIIRFPFDSWEDFQARSEIRPRENLFVFSAAVVKASWIKKEYQGDGDFALYLSLMSTAYFNRALKRQLEIGVQNLEVKRDLWRAKVYAQVCGRGLQNYTWAAIKALENGMQIAKA
ncbi:MAG: hypothetical protein LLG04_02040 [Parachlamydia sp.]|nr:hypothetical protein [Parachlamydia sp.]